jgi:hypothetical protein
MASSHANRGLHLTARLAVLSCSALRNSFNFQILVTRADFKLILMGAPQTHIQNIAVCLKRHAVSRTFIVMKKSVRRNHKKTENCSVG